MFGNDVDYDNCYYYYDYDEYYYYNFQITTLIYSKGMLVASRNHCL